MPTSELFISSQLNPQARLGKEADSGVSSTNVVRVVREEPLYVSTEDPLYHQFRDVLDKFREAEGDNPSTHKDEKPEVFYDDDDDIPDDEVDEGTNAKLSKKKRKQQSKLSIAELKALVKKPEIVEWTDTDSSDPRLLIAIKSYRNVVPVPIHWSLKREYLSSKRGVEKTPFALPKFIQDTGIAEMRDAILEKQEAASLKQRARERVQPKMGKLDIDYQRLYEAFFRYQTKPELTRYGEVYYEGKEFETNLKHLRPGELSDELKEALSMPPGAPPPWLINQQQFGPPPSYPALKIPGLNAPPPPGGQWGYHPGGYGKPPVDAANQPLYGGDIFGSIQPRVEQLGEPIERTLWGELQPQDEDEEEEDEEDEDEDEDEGDDDHGDEQMRKGNPDGLDPSGLQSGARTTTGTTSVTPSSYGGDESVQADFTLRKERRALDSTPRAAGQVVQESNIPSSGFFGSERAYDFKAANNRNLPVLGEEGNERKRKSGDVDISVDVDVLERDDKLSKEELARRYDAQRQAQYQSNWAGGIDQEDLSNMIAEENKKRLKKDDDRRNRR